MKMETIPAEEKYARFIWHILNKIKEKLISQIKGSGHIAYTLFLYPQIKDWDKPNPGTEQELLEKLKNIGVMEETDEKTFFEIGKESDTDNPKSAGITYYFKINEAIFNKQHNYYKKLVEQYNKADKQGNTLVFYGDGRITYIDPSGIEYKTKLKTATNSYSLLSFLVHSPHQVFEFGKLAENLKKARSKVDFSDSDDERRVRDTIQSIKEKLKYQGNDLFESDNGFGLNCDVLIKK